MMIRPGYRELWEMVRDQLRDEIISGSLPPNERLTETELAERFDVSRGPIRTALRDLERVGLVTSSSRRGVAVATFSADDVDELHDLHEALERHALTRGLPYVTPETGIELRAVLQRLEEADAQGNSADEVEADLDFHRHLVGLSRNSRLMETWEVYAEQIRVVIAAVQRADHSVASNGEHPLIVDALLAGDLDSALAAHRRHFEASRLVMARVMAPRAVRKQKARQRDDALHAASRA